MAKAKLKTKPTAASVDAFLKTATDPDRYADCQVIMKIMKKATGQPARMWGPSLVGFGRYQYKYASGHEGEFFLTGFSPRKQNLTLYIMPGFDRYDALLARLGKYKTGKSCLYVKKLEDVDLKVLTELVQKSVAHMKKAHA